LNIVMGVQQHRRRALRRRVARDDGRCPTLADDLHIAKARLRQQLCHRFGAALHLVAARRVGSHRLDPDQVFQILPHRRQYVAHARHQIAHTDEVSGSPFSREQTQMHPTRRSDTPFCVCSRGKSPRA
jgi:hypothetical protein